MKVIIWAYDGFDLFLTDESGNSGLYFNFENLEDAKWAAKVWQDFLDGK